MEGSAPNHWPGDDRKEPFHLVQPGTAGGCEMKVESAPLRRLQPALHLCAFVSAVIVHDEMHFLIGGELLFQMVEELYKFPTTVAILTSADHFAVENIERGEQSGCAMAFIIVRLTLRQPWAQWQNGSRAVQSLNLALFIGRRLARYGPTPVRF